jgi:hypothetical protein
MIKNIDKTFVINSTFFIAVPMDRPGAIRDGGAPRDFFRVYPDTSKATVLLLVF